MPFRQEEVLRKVRDNEPGYAHCRIQGQVVLLFKEDDPIGYFEHDSPLPYNSVGKLLRAMILDTARGDGAASQQTFYRSVIERVIDTRRAFPSDFKQEHREARDLEEYLRDNAHVFI